MITIKMINPEWLYMDTKETPIDDFCYEAGGVSFQMKESDGYGGPAWVKMFIPYSNISWIKLT